MNQSGVRTLAWYGSDESVKGGLDKQFGVEVKWDIPLLEGYEYRFFKNYSWKPSHFNGFFGLINFGMIRALSVAPRSLIIVHGWHYFSHLIVLLLAGFWGHRVCIRNDMPESHEKSKSGWKQTVKFLGLKYLLFPRISYFLFIGKENRLFYESYGIDNSKLVFCPYGVDNERFQRYFKHSEVSKNDLKARLGIDTNDKVILYSGKYIAKKRPLDLVRAYALLNNKNCWLIMMGDGELRSEMEEFIREHRLERVILTGFINQSFVAQYYLVADVFVMCSSYGENWGLSVNEAMNFNLPLVLSDLTGCSKDLIQQGANGYVFPTGDYATMAENLEDVLFKGLLTYAPDSLEIVSQYDYANMLANLKSIL